jgi:alpha-L-rhamnosidase
LTEPRPGVFLFDFGQNFAGHARLRVRGPRGTTVSMRYGERLHPDGTLDQSDIGQHLRPTDPPQRFQEDIYTLKGEGDEEWEPRFTYHGFQYVEVTGYPGRPTRSSVCGRFVHSDVTAAGEFSCSNPVLNKIQQNARWSYLSNLHGIPTDCPHREKNGWTGDAHLAAETGLYNFDTAALYRKWLNDLTDEQRESGELPGIVPTSGWGYHWGNGPAWDSALCLIPQYLYEYTGDVGIFAESYDAMRRYVDYLTTKAHDGIVDFGLDDWMAPGTKAPVAVTSTAHYYRDARIVSDAARLLGKSDDAARYDTIANTIRTAFNQAFFDPKTATYEGGTLTALSAALFHDLCSDKERVRVVNSLLAAIRRQNYTMDVGVLGAKYLLNVLLDAGHADVAYRMVTQEAYPGYAWQIAQGANTLWEKWDGTESRQHIMFGDVSAWFYKAIAGIRADGPGFQRVVIRPHPVGDLSWAKASYATPQGRIESAWERVGGELRLEVRIPPNTSARVFIPGADAGRVLESPVRIGPGAHFMGMHCSGSHGSRAVYEVGPGHFRFASGTARAARASLELTP